MFIRSSNLALNQNTDRSCYKLLDIALVFWSTLTKKHFDFETLSSTLGRTSVALTQPVILRFFWKYSSAVVFTTIFTKVLSSFHIHVYRYPVSSHRFVFCLLNLHHPVFFQNPQWLSHGSYKQVWCWSISLCQHRDSIWMRTSARSSHSVSCSHLDREFTCVWILKRFYNEITVT